MYIGSHLSTSKGFYHMGKEAMEIGANTFAYFTRNPRGGQAKDIDEADIEKLIQLMKDNSFGKLVAHAPYTMNLCAAKEDIRLFSRNMLAEDIKRMEYIPDNYYNFHPGSAVGQDVEVAIQYIADALNMAMYSGMKTTILLETMAGKGSEIGRSFEEIRSIIDKVECKENIGVCFDTCHVWDAGYNIVEDLDGVMKQFDSVIGLERLKAVHFNDSKNECASHKDRHELIGKGCIGKTAMLNIAKSDYFKNLPFILETPNDLAGYSEEIKLIRNN